MRRSVFIPLRFAVSQLKSSAVTAPRKLTLSSSPLLLTRERHLLSTIPAVVIARQYVNPVIVASLLSNQQHFSVVPSLLTLLAMIGLTTEIVRAESSEVTQRRQKFTELFPNASQRYINDFETSLEKFNKNCDKSHAEKLFTQLKRNAMKMGDLVNPMDQGQNQFLINIYDQVFVASHTIDDKFPDIKMDEIDQALKDVRKDKQRVQTHLSMSKEVVLISKMELKSRSFLDDMVKNPLAAATGGAVAGAAIVGLVDYCMGGTLSIGRIAVGAGVGFVVTSAGILIYDYMYEKNIWTNFRKDHPYQAYAFQAINILIISYATKVAIGNIIVTKELAQHIHKKISDLTDYIKNSNMLGKYKDEVIKYIDGLTADAIEQFLTDAKNAGSDAARNTRLLAQASGLDITVGEEMLSNAKKGLNMISTLMEEANVASVAQVKSPSPV